MLLRILILFVFAGCFVPGPLPGAELAKLHVGVNDFANMMPPASVDDLAERLSRFKTRTGYSISVLTVQELDEDIDAFAHRALDRLPLDESQRRKAALLVVARKAHRVALAVGNDLTSLFPNASATAKLQAHLDLYINGLRPDLGIHGGVHFIFGVVTGEFRAGRTTEEEALENASIHGAGAGAIFALILAPFLAFFVSMFLAVYSVHAGFQRETRLFLGLIIGGGTAQLVAMLMSLISPFGDGLWYFIMGLSMVLGAFASLTEYWMQGDWSGIPRVKERIARKPEDNMGI